jgi:RHS repeat-associated protein
MDQLGSVRELVDSAGVVRADYRYSTYGERTKVDGDLESDFGFGGLFHHGPSGLDLATYRTYDSKMGRWISRDPLGEGVDYNLYRYCGNNPINFVDPDGLQPGDDPHQDALDALRRAKEKAKKKVIGTLQCGAEMIDDNKEDIIFGLATDGLGSALAKLAGAMRRASKTLKVEELGGRIIHSADSLGERLDLRNLSDSELLKAARKPIDGKGLLINTKTGNLVDGNSRARELLRRAADPNSKIQPSTKVPYKDYIPSNVDW